MGHHDDTPLKIVANDIERRETKIGLLFTSRCGKSGSTVNVLGNMNRCPESKIDASIDQCTTNAGPDVRAGPVGRNGTPYEFACHQLSESGQRRQHNVASLAFLLDEVLQRCRRKGTSGMRCCHRHGFKVFTQGVKPTTLLGKTVSTKMRKLENGTVVQIFSRSMRLVLGSD